MKKHHLTTPGFLPPFEAFPVLNGTRVNLIEMTPAHSGSLHEIMFYDGKPIASISETIRIIEKIGQDYLKGETVNWAIIEKDSNEPIGTIGYYRGFENDTGEIGFVQRPQFRGKGFMSEAVSLVVQFGRERMHLQRIIAITKSSNEPAIRVLERNRFQWEKPFDTVYEQFICQS